MKAKSIKGNTTEEISTALEQSLSDGFRPTLAIVFISRKQDRTAISALLDKQGISIFGVSTNGEFIDEELQQGTVAIMLLDINRDYFKILFEEYPLKNYRELAAGMAKKTLSKF